MKKKLKFSKYVGTIGEKCAFMIGGISVKFYEITTLTQSQEELLSEYKSAREIGVVRLGETYLFFRKGRRAYYIPYADIRRCFRRVMLVPAKMCCGKGDLPVEHLVIYGDAGELAQVQLPGTRAAKGLIEELKIRIPHAEFTCPPAKTEEN